MLRLKGMTPTGLECRIDIVQSSQYGHYDVTIYNEDRSEIFDRCRGLMAEDVFDWLKTRTER